ncbi:tripartite tricarboxylate transporter substrate-binding protein [Ramlibacter tataouinensis]|uniref:Bug family tripartite tricarboxylate transporter substrate binding protein n=1 Tax=Ramlibacter tataouinensis TaxID=94132 RepID=UPI0022F3D33E|nr:tripartite tricarboxylate transporter substrate-binding protein [Ramlibacter tataouinensis]WBY02355.1 tripartite tricarboxylate transporter substrate-binding protein [Ramlibacter tataouinensis]
MTMSVKRRRLAAIALACSLGALGLQPAAAQDPYPAKPVKLIVPFAPGGSTDIVARLVADRMQQTLGQPVVVDNRAGAGGAIGAEAVAKAAPDGYTIGMGTVSTLAVNPVLLKASRVDPLKDFAPITALAAVPSVFSTHPSLKAGDFNAFVALAKSRPDQLNSGSPGNGSIGHLIIEAMNQELHIQLRHIPYRGMGPVINGALGGETQVLSDQFPSSAPFIKAGKLVPFAVAAEQRLTALPNVPTFKELGHGELNELAITWFGLVAPARTPAPVVAKLQAAAVAALNDPALAARLKEMGMQPIGNTPEQFGQLIASSLERVRAVVKARKIEIE